MQYYFAYGSNMDGDQMKSRCPDSKYIGFGYLPDYKLAFTRFSINRKSTVADILVEPGETVWGKIYSLSDNDFIKLDLLEGVPHSYIRKKDKAYIFQIPSLERVNHEIESGNLSFLNKCRSNLANYKPIEVNLYEVVNKDLALPSPSIDYLKIILDAAEECRFPLSYMEQIRKHWSNAVTNVNNSAIEFILKLMDIIKSGEIIAEAKNQEEWGGANLVITGKIKRKDQINKNYPDDIVVLSAYWKELSWLVTQIYFDESIKWKIDHQNKAFLLKELGLAAIEYQAQHSEESRQGICMAVVERAYTLLL